MRRYAPVFLAVLLIFGCAGVQKGSIPETYYVGAGGSDRNNGLSEEQAFRSLFKALAAASKTPTKTITLLGVLDSSSERSSGGDRIFIIQGTGREQIIIRGKPQAVLSGAGTGRRVVLVKGVSNIRFEDVIISGGESSGEGGGLGIGGGSVITLGPGTVVSGNSALSGGGIALAPGGKLIIDGASVLRNSASGVGGGIAAAGGGTTLLMEGGLIQDNGAEGGGGVAVYEGAAFILRGGIVADNQAAVAGGGIILNRRAAFTMEGGKIQGNKSSGSGGALALLEHCVFTFNEGDISNNKGDDDGGGIVADDTALLNLRGGTIRANRAGIRGGGIFTSGEIIKTPESACIIYGNDAPDGANSAPNGGAVYVYRTYGGMIRETSAGRGVLLDSADRIYGGWEVYGNEISE